MNQINPEPIVAQTIYESSSIQDSINNNNSKLNSNIEDSSFIKWDDVSVGGVSTWDSTSVPIE